MAYKPLVNAPVRTDKGNRGNEAQLAQQALQCYELRLGGARTDEIAKALGVTVKQVVVMIAKHAEKVISPKVEEYRALQDARLDGLMQGLLRDNRTVTPRVVEAMIKIEERRAKIWGSDAPVRVEQVVTVLEGNVEDEVARLAAELGLNIVQDNERETA